MQPALHKKEVIEKASQLLAEMSLAQKIGQMVQVERLTTTPEEVKKFHIGSVLSGAGSCPGDNQPIDWVNTHDEFWMASMEQDVGHLAIPILYGVDAIHGNNNVKGATVFPHNIGLGAANDTKLMYQISKITAKEVLATGIDWTFAPNLAVSRDNHWGRAYESFSEDPEIATRYASSIIDGLQGDLAEESVISCAKHWVGDGGTRYGIDQGDTHLTWPELNQLHVPPYVEAIEAGVLTVMVSFSSWNGEKCHANQFLITEVLKGKLGFDGFVISDMEALDFLSEDFYLSVALGVNAGIDMFMVPHNWKAFIQHLVEHVEFGSVSINRIDDAVRRILSVKIATGAFEADRPKQRKWANHSSFGCNAHREIAREAVRKSLVLLKNERQTLPLDKQKRILVTGRNAHNRGHQCGGFTIDWQGVFDNQSIAGGTSIWEGIKAVAPNASLCDDKNELPNNLLDKDLAIVVIGESSYAEGMGDIRENNNIMVEMGSQIDGKLNVLEPYGNSLELAKLHPEDLESIQAIAEKGIPTVVILVSGRPLVVNKELESSSAFVAAWLPGSEGQGISDVLFGEHNFHGRLSFSWPKQSYPTVNKGDQRYEPLFPIGYGLEY
jgi:beta-glucosidase